MNKLSIILQGGGTKCAYQLSFLKNLQENNEFMENTQIDSIYGTSFGALVGYFYCIDRIDLLLKFFKELTDKSLKPWFNFFNIADYLKKIPIIGKLVDLITNMIWLLMSIKRKSFFDQYSSTGNLLYVKLNTIQEENLKKFNCCVYNITKQQTEYINGSHPLIKEYILASSALWIVFQPKLIRKLKCECVCNDECIGCSGCEYNDFKKNPTDQLLEEFCCTCQNINHKYNEYLDGGYMAPIPFIPEDNYTGKYLILTTKDLNKIIKKDLIFTNSGKHMFEYLDQMIAYLIEYNQYIELNHVNKDKYNRDDVILITYNSIHDDPTIVDQKIIEEYLTNGTELANEFLSNYLNNCNR